MGCSTVPPAGFASYYNCVGQLLDLSEYVCLFIHTLCFLFSSTTPGREDGKPGLAPGGVPRHDHIVPATTCYSTTTTGAHTSPPPAAQRCYELSQVFHSCVPHEAALNGGRLFFLLKFPSEWEAWVTPCLGMVTSSIPLESTNLFSQFRQSQISPPDPIIVTT